MSIETVRNYLRERGLADRIIEFSQSSATVELAAAANHCEPARIAKTLSFAVGDECILIVAAGDAKIDRSTGCKLLLRVPRLFRAGDVHKKRLMARPHESGPRHESRYLRHARPFGHDVDRAACAFETQANYSPTGVWYPTTTQELHNDRNRNSTQRVHIALSQALARGARRAML